MAIEDTQVPFSNLLFYTHNVARALKPSIDGELAHAIHETLHFALDGEPQDYLIDRRSDQPCSGSGSNTPNGVVLAHSSSSNINQTRADDQGEEEDEDEGEDVRPGFFATGDEERPYISYDWEEETGTLVLPHPKTVTNPLFSDPCTSVDAESRLRDAFDITAKFFFLGKKNERHQYPYEWVKEAMKRFTIATGMDSVDTLILAFGDVEESEREKIEGITAVWKELSSEEQILSMGLSDLSQGALKGVIDGLQLDECKQTLAASEVNSYQEVKSSITRDVKDTLANHASNGLLDITSQSHVSIPSSPSRAAFIDLPGDAENARKEYGPGSCRRPRLCTINLKAQSVSKSDLTPQARNEVNNGNCSSAYCWDCSLATYCKANNILLVAHSDRKDILPSRTLTTLMKEFKDTLPHSLPADKQLQPLWVFKYTVLIRDRGVLADKGFLLCAQTMKI